MKNNSFTMLLMILLVAVILSCSIPARTPKAAPVSPTIEPQAPPFLGMWMSETETLVFTEKYLYRVESSSEAGQVHEQFAEIILLDPVQNHITLQIQWVKVNGLSVGFDAPIYSLLYKVDGDVLQIGLGTASEFTAELSPTVYYRK